MHKARSTALLAPYVLAAGILSFVAGVATGTVVTQSECLRGIRNRTRFTILRFRVQLMQNRRQKQIAALLANSPNINYAYESLTPKTD